MVQGSAPKCNFKLYLNQGLHWAGSHSFKEFVAAVASFKHTLAEHPCRHQVVWMDTIAVQDSAYTIWTPGNYHLRFLTRQRGGFFSKHASRALGSIGIPTIPNVVSIRPKGLPGFDLTANSLPLGVRPPNQIPGLRDDKRHGSAEVIRAQVWMVLKNACPNLKDAHVPASPSEPRRHTYECKTIDCCTCENNAPTIIETGLHKMIMDSWENKKQYY